MRKGLVILNNMLYICQVGEMDFVNIFPLEKPSGFSVKKELVFHGGPEVSWFYKRENFEQQLF